MDSHTNGNGHLATDTEMAICKAWPAPKSPTVETMASRAMIETAEAHSIVLQELDRVDHLSQMIRATLQDQREKTDRLNREFISLCEESRASIEALEKILTKIGGKIIDGAPRGQLHAG